MNIKKFIIKNQHTERFVAHYRKIISILIGYEIGMQVFEAVYDKP